MSPDDKRRTLGAMLICRDEADRIEDCLRSLQGWVDEIVVLDSGSRDGTLEIARRYTDKVWSTDWPGYGPQRNRALSKLRSDWVLYIDADERASPELRAEIDRQLSDPALDRNLFRIPWRTWLFGAPLRFGRYSAPQARLFKREGAYFRNDQVHEQVVVPQRREAVLKSALEHYSWRDYRHLQQKHLQYAWLLAKHKHARGQRASLPYAWLRLFTDFLLQYVFRLSFLDGWRGFMISMALGQYAFHKYAALATLQEQDEAARAKPAPPLHAAPPT